MSSPGLLAGVGHVLGVERRQRAIVRRACPGEQGPWGQVGGWLLWSSLRIALPALVVAATWRDVASGRTSFPAPWAYVAVGAVLIGGGQLFQLLALSFPAREVLFLPDKAAVLCARLLRQIPLLLLIGVAWATACWLRLRDAAAQHPVLAGACCAAAGLAPLAATIGRLLRRLDAPDSRASLTLGLVAVLALALALDRPSWAAEDAVYLGVLIPVALLGGLGAILLVRAWWRQPRLELRALWPDALGLPRLAVVCVLLMPSAWLAESDPLRIVVVLAIGALLACAFVACPQLLRLVRAAEAETPARRATPSPARGAVREHARPRHRGRSLWRAGWRLGRLEGRGSKWLAVLVVGGWLAQLLWPRRWGTEADVDAMAATAIAIGLIMPVLLANQSRIELRERLWLWGVDRVQLARHQVCATLLGAALPVLAAMVIAATWQGWTQAHVLLTGAVGATFLLRVGWRGFAPKGELEPIGGWFLLIVLAILVVAFVAPVLQWYVVLPALALGVLGLALRIARWREPRLVAAHAAARERQGRAAG